MSVKTVNKEGTEQGLGMWQMLKFTITSDDALVSRAKSADTPKEDASLILVYFAQKGKTDQLKEVALDGESDEIAKRAVEKLAEAKEHTALSEVASYGKNDEVAKLAVEKLAEANEYYKLLAVLYCGENRATRELAKKRLSKLKRPVEEQV